MLYHWFTFLVLFSFASPQPTFVVPHFRWTQTAPDIVLTVNVRCDGERQVALTVDTFLLSCRQDDTYYRLSFTLREDINVTESRCTPRNGQEICVLQKRWLHLFDRLTQTPNLFKKRMVREPIPPDQPVPGVDDYFVDEDYYYDSPIQEVTSKTLNATLSMPFVVLDVSFPWCADVCKTAKLMLAQAAQQLQSQADWFFGYIDARSVPRARRIFNPVCSPDCPMYVHRANDGIFTIPYSLDFEKFVKAIHSHSFPLLAPLETKKDIASLKKVRDVAVVGSFAHAGSAEARAFRQAAIALRGTHPIFGVAYAGVIPQLQSPSITIFKPHDNKKAKFRGDLLRAEEIVRFVRVHSKPALQLHNWLLREDLVDIGLPIVLLFEDDPQHSSTYADKTASKDAAAALLTVAREFLDHAIFLEMHKSQTAFLLQDFGLPETTPGPVLCLETSLQPNARRFRHTGPMTVAAMREFVLLALNGTLKRARRTEPAPPVKTWEPGTPRRMAWVSVEQYMESKEAVSLFLVVHQPFQWPEVEVSVHELAHALRTVPNVTVGYMDSDPNDFLWEELGASRFSMFAHGFLFPSPSEPIQTYYGRVEDEDEVLIYLSGKLPHIANNPEVRAWLDILRARREAIDSARLQLAYVVENEHQESLTEDSGVTKQLIEPGSSEDFPTQGSTVRVHFTGMLLAGSEFDSTRWLGKSGDPTSFVVGNQPRGTPICWSIAVVTMRVQERAAVTCSPQYAYGTLGLAPYVSANQTVRFDLQLVGFNNPAERDEL
eukprot:TRINITY_DN21796_c0_g1_i1.p1 TRINITY_DN21796_c0_g1~~TRINITY_DN21796_c0_g1_i1.p1  ORF type:complete len:781 (-),score=110.92 TRINITY_DN21796_c0_g1_i1:112-2427(-)